MNYSTVKRFIIYSQFRFTTIAKYGLLGIIKRLIKKFSALLLAITLFPISLILYLYNFRRVMFFTERIGHWAIEPDILLKAQHLNLIKKYRWLIIANQNHIANHHLLNYWRDYFYIVTSPVFVFIFHSLTLWPFMRYDVKYFINKENDAQFGYKVYSLWDDKPPLLKLKEKDEIWGQQQLLQMGVPKNAWFVCVHAREGGFSPVDEVLHSHRNGAIENLKPAIQAIVSQGGWVIRLGDPTMKPLEPIPHVIDYALHKQRSARLDIYLCARAKFILGNTSGIFLVGTIFGTASALANMIPIPTLGFLKDDLSIPKLLLDRKTNLLLSFKKIMTSPIAKFRYAKLYEENNIEVIENNSDDILALTKEMMQRLNQTYVDNQNDIQNQMIYKGFIQHHHYSFGSISRISTEFLRKYHSLLN